MVKLYDEDMTRMYINWDVIVRRILGKATEQDNERVERWLAEDESNRTYYRKAERYFNVYYTGEKQRQVDVEEAWNEFLVYAGKSRNRLRLRRRITIAAAIVFPVFILAAVFWLSREEKPQVEVAQNMPLLPGNTKAVLLTSAGEEVGLSDTTDVERVIKALSERQDEMVAREEVGPREEAKYNTIIVPRGGEFRLTLADGTNVVVNSDSRLRFPDRFVGAKREVFLTGEAFFEVAKDSLHPFVVGVRESNVRVLGTSFNVKGYLDDDYIQTTLVEGRVAFQASHDAEIQEMRPGQQVTYDRETGECVSREVNTSVYTAWVKGMWVLEGVRLEEIMKQLSRWYDVTVFYQNPKAKDLVFTGDLERYENCEIILNMISLTTNVKFEVKDREIIVE